jgi:hypothetical protein
LLKFSDFEETVLQDLITALSNDGFDAYITSVGGNGLGILSPYRQQLHPESGPETPPETPNGSNHINGNDSPPEPLQPHFETTAGGDLADWAGGLGRWMHV